MKCVDTEFSLEDFYKGKYNKSYLIQVNPHYLVIWRKTGSGFFSLPIEIYKPQVSRLVDLAKFDLKRVYNVEDEPVFVGLIDEVTKDLKKVVKGNKKVFKDLLAENGLLPEDLAGLEF